MASKVKLQLGDIIEIIAPNDTELDNNTYYIGYIDPDKIRLEEVSGKETLLTLTEGSLDNESIESIRIKPDDIQKIGSQKRRDTPRR